MIQNDNEPPANIPRGLYPTPQPHARDIVQEKYTYSLVKVLRAALVFSLPFIILNAVYNVFTAMYFDNRTDLAGGMVIFSIAFLLVGLLIIGSIRFFYRSLQRNTLSGRTVFWLTLVLVVPAFWFIRTYITTSNNLDMTELIFISGAYATLAVAFVTVATMLFERILATK